MLDIQKIMEHLPHRYPFLLVDRIVEVVPGEKVVGLKNVTINEPCFQGHFPDHPILPGVLIVEAMAQVGGIFALANDEIGEDKLTYFVGIEKARFRRPVRPGDSMLIEMTQVGVKRGIYTFAGKAFVDGKVVAEATLMATFVDK
ncbi:MAG: 3-hydroxyacyl-[acyl-carrier-protein] dehydratase FabZ [Deltaproteobacteria bacterium]|nr:MAG: 3-hydroxyacyl-[acyl-carrier-protein] dehydratase FabZ [Deltaproteobacteria bacterium]